MIKNRSAPKPGLRPSPNEANNLIQAEIERRRKLRIKQVREQEKAFALKLRRNVKNKRENELELLSQQLKQQWKEKQLVQQASLEKKYHENLEGFGEGHHAAFKDEDAEKPDHRELTKEEKKKALERHNKAMIKLMIDRAQDQQSDFDKAEARMRAMETERARAAHMASLPRPKDAILNFDLSRLTHGEQKVQPQNAEHFKSTHYHLQPVVQVTREPALNDQVNANEAAEEVGEIIDNVIEASKRSQAEQTEKAWLRHKHALAQHQLAEDHKALMTELSGLERLDRQRRQEAVARIPVRIFQPPHKRVEDAEERQKDLEQAFEDMYMIQTGYTGDLTIALERAESSPLQPPASSESPKGSTMAHEIVVDLQDNSKTQEVTVIPVEDSRKRDDSRSEDEESIVEKEDIPTRQDPVRRLLGRIQKQRDDWKRRQTTDEEEAGFKPDKLD